MLPVADDSCFRLCRRPREPRHFLRRTWNVLKTNGEAASGHSCFESRCQCKFQWKSRAQPWRLMLNILYITVHSGTNVLLYLTVNLYKYQHSKRGEGQSPASQACTCYIAHSQRKCRRLTCYLICIMARSKTAFTKFVLKRYNK